jgi:hypothetical protein
VIHNGDCLEVLKTLEPNSLDSLVTDPPAGIAFMGKDWDKDKGGRDGWVSWMTDVMRECHRVLKPGAHGLVWAIPRTSHWTMTALENAGFEIRDVVTHLFGSGFPKSMDVSKAIDKAAGAERVVTKVPKRTPDGKTWLERRPNGIPSQFDCFNKPKEQSDRQCFETAPATDAAKEWQGFGTALKPACEFWVLIRKPLGEKTVAANVLKHGTGALNIDGCRIEGGARPLIEMDRRPMGASTYCGAKDGSTSGSKAAGETTLGRFPANLVLTCCGSDPHEEDCAVRMLDEQSGVLKPGGNTQFPGRGTFPIETTERAHYKDVGGASRFFYVAKASRSDRNRKAKDG